jgi:polyhydroxybutyrate depolymerase
MNRIAVTLLLGLVFTACRRDVEWTFTPEGFRENESIAVGGTTRSYDLFVPPGQQNSPVVFLLHGHGGSKEQVVGRDGQPGAYWRWLSIAMEHDLILVIPNGSIGPDKKRGWNDCRINSKTPDTDDIGFMQALLDRVKADFDVDTTCVYVNGTSNGGFMAQRMAQKMP